jgi:NodT family efflux transporter outer membrane factor (OMF) lipoprotein
MITLRDLVRLCIASLLFPLVVSGCAVGPDFKAPEPPLASSYSPSPMVTETEGIGPDHGGVQVLVAGRDIPAEWWTVFQSPGLDALIKRAFLASPSVASAEAALHQAQELVYAQQGAFFPTVQASYTPTRQKLAGNLGGNAPGLQGNGAVIAAPQNPRGPNYTEPVIYNFHTAQLSIDYVPDVFGGNRRQVESLEAQQEMQRFQLEATYLSLAGNIVAAAIAEASLREQIRATNVAIKANLDALDILRHQQRVGYAMDMDVAVQAAATEQLKASLPPLEKSFQQTRDQLRALAGCRH